MLSYITLSTLSSLSILSYRYKPSRRTLLIFVSYIVYPTILILLSVFYSYIALKR